MSQYGQMQMPPYNSYPPGYQQPMQQPMTQDTRDYINRMRQQIDQFEQRFSQPPMQQQQPMQQPMVQPQMQPQPQQQAVQLVMYSVTSIDEAQNYPPDLTGKKQWFVNGEEIYSKQFNVKTAGLEFHKYAVNDSEPEETPPQEPESKPDPQFKQDEINALRAEIAALNDKYKELEGKVNAKSDVVRHDGRRSSESTANATEHDAPAASSPTELDAGSVSGNTGNVERGTKPAADNRKRDAAKPKPDANTVGADSKRDENKK